LTALHHSLMATIHDARQLKSIWTNFLFSFNQIDCLNMFYYWQNPIIAY